MKKILEICFAVIILWPKLYSQSGEVIVPDRPGLGESAHIILLGSFQIESGFNVEWNNDLEENRKSYTFNSTTLRYGISQSLEIRAVLGLQQNYFFKFQEREATELGLSPFSLGFKTRITENHGLKPRIALLGNLTIPYAASKSFRATHVAPSILLPMEWDISKQLLLTFNTGTSWEEGYTEPVFFNSLSLDVLLLMNLGVFIESYVDIEKRGLFFPGLDAGIVWRLKPNLQIDLSAGIGLTDEMADGFVNFGLSYRISRKQEK
ncbi:MAG: transporter [Saprospiraceae bacterium]